LSGSRLGAAQQAPRYRATIAEPRPSSAQMRLTASAAAKLPSSYRPATAQLPPSYRPLSLPAACTAARSMSTLLCRGAIRSGKFGDSRLTLAKVNVRSEAPLLTTASNMRSRRRVIAQLPPTASSNAQMPSTTSKPPPSYRPAAVHRPSLTAQLSRLPPTYRPATAQLPRSCPAAAPHMNIATGQLPPGRPATGRQPVRLGQLRTG